MATTMRAGDVPEWTLSDRLRKAREHADLKQVELADLTGISRASIVNYESGKYTPRRPALASWAMACGVSFEWLAQGEELGPDSGPGLESPVTNRNTQVIDLTPRLKTPPEQGQRAA